MPTDYIYKDAWHAFWKRIGARCEGRIERIAHADLVARYNERHRFYHTLVHIQDCLEKLGEIRNCLAMPDAVEMALWYHDAIYDIRAKDNEEKSAWLFRVMSQEAGFSKAFSKQVVNLILATKHTQKSVVDPDMQFLLDIDLSILGEEEGIFDQYEEQIRKEYKWVSDQEFARGRSKILKSFLDRSSIYSTEFFRNKYETQARQNIFRSLARLSNYL